jgi:serine/threonine-protein kinase
MEEVTPSVTPPTTPQSVADSVPPTRGDLPSETTITAEMLGWHAGAIPGYELLGELGRGGMGVVYKARQVKLNRIVALKAVLHAAHAGSDAHTRFHNEARAVARLVHPNIVQVHEIGEHNGLPFFSMEFCPGGTLARRLAEKKAMPAQEAASLVRALALAVQAAHEQQVIHRDLKPANVLIAADGTPKVADFGLAKCLDESNQTRSGAILGTPSYMAPEQARGKTREVGPATDVYALGAILYECLTGRPPFAADSAVDTLMQVVSERPPLPRRYCPDLPPALETICLRCLEKDARRRYSSAAALAGELEKVLKGTLDALPASPWRRKWWVGAAGLLGVVLSAVVWVSAGALSSRTEPKQPRAEQPSEQGPATPDPAKKSSSVIPLAAGADLFGILAGVNDYTRLGMATPFSCAVNDARALHELFEAQRGKAYRRVELSLLLDHEVTRQALLEGITQIARKARPQDWAVVYLAGHGERKKKDGRPEPGSYSYFCPGTDRKDPSGTALPQRDLFDAVNRLPCRVLVLLDACGCGDVAESPAVKRDNPGRVLVIAACKGHEQSYELPLLKQGVFTQAVIEALGSRFVDADRNKDGLLDAGELQDYIRERVPRLLDQVDNAGPQTPIAFPAALPRFAIARNPLRLRNSPN